MNDTKDPDQNPERNEKAVKLLCHLFHAEYCEIHNVDESEKVSVSPRQFYEWLDKTMPLMNSEDFCEKAGVDAEIWQFVRNLVDSGNAPEATAGLWYTIVLSKRPTPESAIRSINLVCNITFLDGTISTSQGFVTREMFEAGAAEVGDGIAFTIVRNVMRQVLESMAESGLAKLYERSQRNQFTSTASEDPFEVLMGWVIKHMLRGEPMPGKLKPELLKPVETYMRLAQQCIRPPIPEHVITGFKAKQQKDAAKAAGRPRGGWET